MSDPKHKHRWTYDRGHFSRRCKCGVVQIRLLVGAEKERAEQLLADYKAKGRMK